MCLLDPLCQFANRVDVFRIAGSLLAEGLEDSVVLSLEIPIDPHSKPAENNGNPHAKAKTS